MKYIVRFKYKGEHLRDDLFNDYESAHDYFLRFASYMTNEVDRHYAFTYKDCYCNKEREIELIKN